MRSSSGPPQLAVAGDKAARRHAVLDEAQVIRRV